MQHSRSLKKEFDYAQGVLGTIVYSTTGTVRFSAFVLIVQNRIQTDGCDDEPSGSLIPGIPLPKITHNTFDTQRTLSFVLRIIICLPRNLMCTRKMYNNVIRNIPYSCE